MDDLAILEEAMRAMYARKPGGLDYASELGIALALACIKVACRPRMIAKMAEMFRDARHSDMNLEQFMEQIRTEMLDNSRR